MKRGEQSRRALERYQEVIRLRRSGLNNRQVAKELGVTERVVATLFYRAKQDGLDVPPSPYRSGRRS